MFNIAVHSFLYVIFQYESNESLDLYYLICFFFNETIGIVYFSLYYSIVDKMLVENIWT